MNITLGDLVKVEKYGVGKVVNKYISNNTSLFGIVFNDGREIYFWSDQVKLYIPLVEIEVTFRKGDYITLSDSEECGIVKQSWNGHVSIFWEDLGAVLDHPLNELDFPLVEVF